MVKKWLFLTPASSKQELTLYNLYVFPIPARCPSHAQNSDAAWLKFDKYDPEQNLNLCCFQSTVVELLGYLMS